VRPEVITRLHAETVKALAQPDVRERIAANGADAVGSSPEDFASFIRNERAKYARIIKEANIKLD
jgi:tripartite-type tricarboxylate transporter receptor subunit TctC